MKKQVLVTRESLQQMLNAADAVKRQHIIGRALVALYERQTAAEQAANSTQEDNGVGFAGCDSHGGSLTARSYMKHKILADWQVERWTRMQKNGFARICKYAGQLNEIAVAKAQKQGVLDV